ncbi:MAG: 2-oxoacid:acceptor oxidoreductase family protein [Clostridium sp.]|uniref:2-oxoacid:acceptor oxidoreductase family protein n=1 Tax=Clostridium sp. TaxID=1506 RepID=UPI003D6C9B6B
MDKREIIFTGLGGQGIVKAGIILAEAAVLEGMHVVQTQNYGPESRGGCCRADVIIWDKDISYPRVDNADIILALSQSGYDKFKNNSAEGAVVIVDETVDIEGDSNCIKLPLIEASEVQLKNPQSINMLCLGALAAVTKLVNYESLKKAISENVPRATLDKNMVAFNKGISMVEALA